MGSLFTEHLLTVVVFLPALGAALILLFPRSLEKEAKVFALLVAIADGLISLPLWTRFDLAQKGFQFREQVDWIPALGISYSLGIDGISLLLVLLTTILTPIALREQTASMRSVLNEAASVVAVAGVRTVVRCDGR